MQQEFGEYIKELLYKHQRLSIPDFGSFELVHAPALLDQVQTQLAAPSMDISFNDHLVMDDGILTNYLVKQKNWDVDQSQQWLKEQVNAIKSALDEREIVELKGVGRFFRNFEHQLKFVAENNNFNTDSYGLKKITAQAVNRTIAERKGAHSATPVIENIPKVTTAKPTWLRQNLWWVALLFLGAIALATYLFLPKNTTAKPIVDVPEERLNTSPSKDTDEQTANLTPGESQQNTMDDEKEEVTLTKEDDPPESVLAPEEHTAIIAVGLFSNKRNVQKLLEKLSKQGFSPISQDENGKTRVGVSIRFEEEQELQAVLKEVQRKQEKSAFVMYRDGVRVE